MEDLTTLEESQAKRIKDLERKNLELTASLTCMYHFADVEINKASIDRMMGSAVLLQLTAIGGKEIINPVMIKDGLSNETIECIKKDLVRSYEESTLFKPKGVTKSK